MLDNALLRLSAGKTGFSKRLIYIFIAASILVAASQLIAADGFNSESLKAGRREKDEFFKSTDSPLNDNQRKKFKALKYFPVNPKYFVKAKLVPFNKKDTINMLTSKKEKNRKMIRYGRIEFTLEGSKYALTGYYSLPLNEESSLFVPFGDQTNGKDTYKGGRYLDLEVIPGTKEIQLDFNLAYNPYCAYNDKWSCPLIPSENILQIRIEAGEKKFK